MTYEPIFGMNVLVETTTYNALVTAIPSVAFFMSLSIATLLWVRSLPT